MPATNAWSEATPAGTDLVSSLDNTIRAKLLDVRERMELEHYWNDSASLDGLHINITQAGAGIIANKAFINGSGYSLTGSNAQSMVDYAGTWNTTGTPTAVKFNVTDTASNAASLMMDLQVGGVSKFSVSKAGVVVAGGTTLGAGVTLSTMRVYTASNTWSKPAGLHSVVVWVVGAGGGGGGTVATGAGENAAAGGGSGGGTSMKRIPAASLGATETVTVGAAGAAGGAGNNAGGTGGTSSFGAHLTASGGVGGPGCGNLGGIANINESALGAVGTGSSGDLNFSGNPGHRGMALRATGNCGGGGGASFMGGGGSSSVNATGNGGQNYGGGGGGASAESSTVAKAGGAGAAGVVIVYEYI